MANKTTTLLDSKRDVAFRSYTSSAVVLRVNFSFLIHWVINLDLPPPDRVDGILINHLIPVSCGVVAKEQEQGIRGVKYADVIGRPTPS